MYIMHSCLVSHIYEQFLLKSDFQIPQFLGSKPLLNQMCSNGLYKENSSIQVLLPFWSSMLKSFPIFKRNGAHLVEKKNVWKKQGLSILRV